MPPSSVHHTCTLFNFKGLVKLKSECYLILHILRIYSKNVKLGRDLSRIIDWHLQKPIVLNVPPDGQ